MLTESNRVFALGNAVEDFEFFLRDALHTAGVSLAEVGQKTSSERVHTLLGKYISMARIPTSFGRGFSMITPSATSRETGVTGSEIGAETIVQVLRVAGACCW